MHFGLVGEPDNHKGLLVYMIWQHLSCQADPKLEMKYALLPKYFYLLKNAKLSVTGSWQSKSITAIGGPK